jgi:hypothetical protein
VTISVYGTAHTLGAFRACSHGDAIAYAATLESNGPAAVAAILTQLRRRRYLTDHAAIGCRHHAVLDILNDNDQIVDTICIPDRSAFDHLREALRLRVTSSDCDRGCN